MKHTFSPTIKILGDVQATWDVDTLTNETCVYAASPAKVRKVCGPVARTILASVPQTWFTRCRNLGMLPNIDVRVHRLNIGEYPAVPGWHCDGALRETYFGQPDPERVPIRDTILCVVSSVEGGVSNPQVAAQPITVDLPDDPPNDFVLWREVHKQMPEKPTYFDMSDGKITMISCETLHRCMPAHIRGVRMLFRMSMWHNDYLGDGGKLAKTQQVYRVLDQETVYVPSEGHGW